MFPYSVSSLLLVVLVVVVPFLCLYLSGSIVSFLCHWLELSSWFRVRVRVSWDPSFGIEINIYDIVLHAKVKNILTNAISFHLPLKCSKVSLTHLRVKWVLLGESRSLVPWIYVTGLHLDFLVTCLADWNAASSVQEQFSSNHSVPNVIPATYAKVAWTKKHQLANHLSLMVENYLTGHVDDEASTLSLLLTICKDAFVSNFCLTLCHFELSLRSPFDDITTGVIWRSVSLTPVAPATLPLKPFLVCFLRSIISYKLPCPPSTLDCVNDLGRDLQWKIVADDVHLYIDPCSCESVPAIPNLPLQHSPPHDYLLIAQSTHLLFTIPLVFTALTRAGKRPNGHLRRLSVSGNCSGVVISFHEQQMSSLLHVVLPSLWSNYQGWKDAVCDRLHVMSRRATPSEELEYIELYRTWTVVSAGKYLASAESIARIEYLERVLSLSSIMSLRRRARQWNLQLAVPVLQRVNAADKCPQIPKFPGQTYNTFEQLYYDHSHDPSPDDDDGGASYIQDDLLRKFVEWRRPIYDNELQLFKEIVLSPIHVTDIRIPIFCATDSHDENCSGDDHVPGALSTCHCTCCRQKYLVPSLHDMCPMHGGQLQSALHAEVAFASVRYLLGKNPSYSGLISGLCEPAAIRRGGACGACDFAEEPLSYQLEASVACSNFRIEWINWVHDSDNGWLEALSGKFESIDDDDEESRRRDLEVYPIIVESRDSAPQSTADTDAQSYHFLVDYKRGTEGAAAYRVDSKDLVVNALLIKESLQVIEQFLKSLRRQRPEIDIWIPESFFIDDYNVSSRSAGLLFSPYSPQTPVGVGSVMRGSLTDVCNDDGAMSVRPVDSELVLQNRLMSALIRFARVDIIFSQSLPFHILTKREGKKTVPSLLLRSTTELSILSGEGAEEVSFLASSMQLSCGSLSFRRPLRNGTNVKRVFGYYRWRYNNMSNQSKYFRDTSTYPRLNAITTLEKTDEWHGNLVGAEDLSGMHLDHCLVRYTNAITDMSRAEWQLMQIAELLESAYGTRLARRVTIFVTDVILEENQCPQEEAAFDRVSETSAALSIPCLALQCRWQTSDVETIPGNSVWCAIGATVRTCVASNRSTCCPSFISSQPHESPQTLNELNNVEQQYFRGDFLLTAPHRHIAQESVSEPVMEMELRLYDGEIVDGDGIEIASFDVLNGFSQENIVGNCRLVGVSSAVIRQDATDNPCSIQTLDVPILNKFKTPIGKIGLLQEVSLPIVNIFVSSLRGVSVYEQAHQHLSTLFQGEMHVTIAATIPQYVGARDDPKVTTMNHHESRYLIQSTCSQHTSTTEHSGRPIMFNEYFNVPYNPAPGTESATDLEVDVVLKCVPDPMDDEANSSSHEAVTLATGSIIFPYRTKVGSTLSTVLQLLDTDRVLVGELEIDLKWAEIGEEVCERFARLTSKSKRRSSSRGKFSRLSGGTVPLDDLKRVRRVQREMSVDVGNILMSMAPTDLQQAVSVATAVKGLVQRESSQADDTDKAMSRDSNEILPENSASAGLRPPPVIERQKLTVKTAYDELSPERAHVMAVEHGNRYSHGGDLTLRLGDINSREFTASILNKYPNISVMLSKNPPSIHKTVGRFWLLLKQHTSFGEEFSPRCTKLRHDDLFSTPLPEQNTDCDRSGIGGVSRKVRDDKMEDFDKTAAMELQKQLILLYHDYAFAVEAWGLLIVPRWLNIPTVGKIGLKRGLSAGKSKMYIPMHSPVCVGSKVFVDSSTTIVSFVDAPALLRLPLTGIRTARGDFTNSSSKFLSFEVSGECTVYLCWDLRAFNNTFSTQVKGPLHMRLLPSWVERRGFQLTDMRIRTTSSIHVVLAKHYPAKTGSSVNSGFVKVTLGGCHGDKRMKDMNNFFVLASSPLSLIGRSMSSENLKTVVVQNQTQSTPKSMLKPRDVNFDTPGRVSGVFDLLNPLSQVISPQTPFAETPRLQQEQKEHRKIDTCMRREEIDKTERLYVPPIDFSTFRWHLMKDMPVNDDSEFEKCTDEHLYFDAPENESSISIAQVDDGINDDFTMSSCETPVCFLPQQLVHECSMKFKLSSVNVRVASSDTEERKKLSKHPPHHISDFCFCCRHLDLEVAIGMYCPPPPLDPSSIYADALPSMFLLSCFNKCMIRCTGELAIQVVPLKPQSAIATHFKGHSNSFFGRKLSPPTLSLAYILEPTPFSVECDKQIGSSTLNVDMSMSKPVIVNISSSMLFTCRQLCQDFRRLRTSQLVPERLPMNYSCASANSENVSSPLSFSVGTSHEVPGGFGDDAQKGGNKKHVVESSEKNPNLSPAHPVISVVIVKNLLGQEIHLEINSKVPGISDSDTRKSEAQVLHEDYFQFDSSRFRSADLKETPPNFVAGSDDENSRAATDSMYKCFCKLPAQHDAHVHAKGGLDDDYGVDTSTISLSVETLGWSGVHDIDIPLPTMSEDTNGQDVWSEIEALYRICKTKIRKPSWPSSLLNERKSQLESQVQTKHVSFLDRGSFDMEDEFGNDMKILSSNSEDFDVAVVDEITENDEWLRDEDYGETWTTAEGFFDEDGPVHFDSGNKRAFGIEEDDDEKLGVAEFSQQEDIVDDDSDDIYDIDDRDESESHNAYQHSTAQSSGVSASDMFVTPFKDLKFTQLWKRRPRKNASAGNSSSQSHSESLSAIPRIGETTAPRRRGSSSTFHSDKSNRLGDEKSLSAALRDSPFAMHVHCAVILLPEMVPQDSSQVVDIYLPVSSENIGSSSGSCRREGRGVKNDKPYISATPNRWALEITLSSNVAFHNTSEGQVKLLSAVQSQRNATVDDSIGDTVEYLVLPGETMPLSLVSLREGKFQIRKGIAVDNSSEKTEIDELLFSSPKNVSLLRRFFNPDLPARLRTSHLYDMQSLSINYEERAPDMTQGEILNDRSKYQSSNSIGADDWTVSGSVKLLHWNVVLAPAMLFINALPCEIWLEVTQINSSHVSGESCDDDESEKVRGDEVAAGAHSLLFIPGGYSDYDGTTITHPTSNKGSGIIDEIISPNPFRHGLGDIDNNQPLYLSTNLQPGESFPVCSLNLRKQVVFRISLMGKTEGEPLWSSPRVVSSPYIHGKRSLFQKHKGEEIRWEYSRCDDLCRKRASEGIKFQRAWKKTREVVVYADYWLVNKTGVSLQYEMEHVQKESNHHLSQKYSLANREFNLSPLPFCRTEYSDDLHLTQFDPSQVPVMISCPNRLRLLPRGLATPDNDVQKRWQADAESLFVYDFKCVSERSYHPVSRINQCPAFELGSCSSAYTDCPVYSDEPWRFSLSSWPKSLLSLLRLPVNRSSNTNDFDTEQTCGLYIQAPNADRYSNPHNNRNIIPTGSTRISTVNHPESAPSRQPSFISFKTSQSVFVYVALDARAAKIPSWVHQLGFMSTGDRVHTTDSTTVYYLHRKFYRAGDLVSLGGSRVNASADSVGKGKTVNMYLLFVIAAPVDHTEPTVGAVVRHSSPRSLWHSSAHLLSSLLKSAIAAVTRRSRRSTRTCQLRSCFKKGDCVYSEDQLRMNSLCTKGNENNHVDISEEPVTVVTLPRLLSKLTLLAVQTNKADRFISSNHIHHLALELLHPTRVFLCIDKRLLPSEYPTWVSATGFVDTNLCVHTSLVQKPNAAPNEGVFRIFHRSFGTETCMLGGLGASSSTLCNYFILLADEMQFLTELSFFPVNSIPGCYTSTSYVSDQIPVRDHSSLSPSFSHSLLTEQGNVKTPLSIVKYWESSAHSRLTVQQPLFTQQGRHWSKYFEPRTKGEILTSCMSLSLAPITLLPGIFSRTQVITLLPRFLFVNNLPVAVRLLPQRGLFSVVKQCSPRPLQPGQTSPYTASQLLDIDVKATTLVLPGQTCVLYSFEDVSGGHWSSFSKAGTGRKRRRWVRICCDVECRQDDRPNSRRPSVNSTCSSTRLKSFSTSMLRSLCFSHPLSLDDAGESHVWLPISSASLTSPSGLCTPRQSHITSAATPLTSPPRIHRPQSSESSESTSPGLLASSSVLLVDSSVVMTLNDASHCPPYRLENRTTNMIINVRQNLGKQYRKQRRKWMKRELMKYDNCFTQSSQWLDCPSRDVFEEKQVDDMKRNTFLSRDSDEVISDESEIEDEGDEGDDDDEGDNDSWLMLPPHSWKSFIWEDTQLERHIELAVAQVESSRRKRGTITPKIKPVAICGTISLDEIGPVDNFEFMLTSLSPSDETFVKRKCAIGGYIYADGATRVLVLHEVSPTDRLLSRQLSMSLRPSPIKIRRSMWRKFRKTTHPQVEKRKHHSSGSGINSDRATLSGSTSRKNIDIDSGWTAPLWQHVRSVLNLRVSLSCLQLNIVAESESIPPLAKAVLQELLSLTVKGFVLQVCKKPSSDGSLTVAPSLVVQKQCDVWCSHMQVDDMRPAARFPVIFSPVPLLTPHDPDSRRDNCKSSFFSNPDSPHVHMRCEWVEELGESSFDGRHLVHIKELEVVMREMHLKVDMDLILELIKHIGQTMQELTLQDFTRGGNTALSDQRRRGSRFTSSRSKDRFDASRNLFDRRVANARSSDEQAALLSHDAVRVVFSHTLNSSVLRATTVASQAKAIYIELFHHCSLTLHVELFVGQRFQHLDLTQQMLSSDSSSSSSASAAALGLAVLGSPVLSILSQIVSTISHTSPSFRFNALVVSNYFGSVQNLLQTLQGSLLQQLLQQAYKVFGSMEVLGDPLELVENLGTGVAEFFSHTKAEMIGRADTRGEGVKRLAQAVVGGTFGSAAKMSGSLAEMVRQVAGPGIGGVVAAPLTGALGAVSVVTGSVSQSTRVPSPQASQQRMRSPRQMLRSEGAFSTLIPQETYSVLEREGTVPRASSKEHATSRHIMTLDKVEERDWSS